MESYHQGWIGDREQLIHVLDCYGADRDGDGKFFVGGSITVGLGGQEVVVGADAFYLRDGKRLPLVGALYSTSYGVKITVI